MGLRAVQSASLAVAALLSAGCSSGEDHLQGPEESATEDTSSPPNVRPSAAPGVAFNYAYEFSLPDERISAAQEAHAVACEKLGLQRCRITGMSYSVDQDEHVTAELALKLHPLIARQFGKSAQQVVERSDGSLIRLEIGSSDEGPTIEQASRQKSDNSARITELQAELARTKPGTEARANLLNQIQSLRRLASEQSRVIESSQAALASTPMKLHYYGRGGVPGFRENPVRAAWQTFVTTIIWLVQILLQLLAVLLPVGLLAAGAVALWRTRPLRALRHWLSGAEE